MKKKSGSLGNVLKKDMKRYWQAYLMVLPVVVFYLLFSYKPMYGILIAFKDYSPAAGVWGSPWVGRHGMQNFIDFFGSYYFRRILKNTVVLSLSSLVFGFPAPIILALLLNEVKNERFKRVTQTISYLPHFISLVVICGMIKMFVANTGIITQFLGLFGFQPTNLLGKSQYFPAIYVLSNIWAGMGWDSILYLSALSGIDQDLYESARIDGAGRWQQTIHVTLPGISATIIIMLLMRLGSLMNVGYEKIILLYNEGIYETADVISTFVYRYGLLNGQWGYSVAVGLFNSVINFIIILFFNRLSRKLADVSLW